MSKIPRFYDTLLHRNLAQHRQMAFLAGPRQVGKTTSAKGQGGRYLTWDNSRDRNLILQGAEALGATLGVRSNQPARPKIALVLDELHKYRNWKRFLKGFFDLYEESLSIIVTGSSRLDVYRRGGDSMMGRYFLYHMHPLSVAELMRQDIPASPVRPPSRLPEAAFKALWDHGGFPEPYLKKNAKFSELWRLDRRARLLREDIRETTLIQNLTELEQLMLLLESRSSAQISYRSLSGDLGITEPTVKKWILALSQLHHGYLLSPWHRNVIRSLRKEPKWHLRDWSGIADPGQRAETFVACHLLKAVEAWRDMGLGDYKLHYLRDKEKREVDLVVVKGTQPWLLVEVKHKDRQLSPHLVHFAKKLQVPHALQVVVDAPYENSDCFKIKGPAWVPARTFLSQLI